VNQARQIVIPDLRKPLDGGAGLPYREPALFVFPEIFQQIELAQGAWLDAVVTGAAQ
jgi:hypothetical protein